MQKPVGLALKLFLPLAVVVLLGVLFYGHSEIERELTRLRSQETLNVGLGAGTLSRNLESISSDLGFLSTHSALRQVLDESSPQNLQQLADDFANFSRSKGIYDQLRWLDETGMERVRVDFVQGKGVVVPAEKLQNKAQRYFFADSFKLQPGEVFVSPLDLNIEQNKIEEPYKPMVRLATPVADRYGNKRGIVILNYYGRDMLDAFSTATSNISKHIMVLNGEGYWLKSPNPADEWGFMFKKPELSLAARNPVAWEQIRANDRGQVTVGDGLWTWETVYPLLASQKTSTGAVDAFVPSRGEIENKQYVWKAVAHLSGDVLAAIQQAVWLKLAGVAALLLGLLGLGCWKLAQAWAAQAAAEEAVRRINAGLEATVAERTQQLHDKLLELDDANAELARRNEEMESMIYIASHDLRSPLVNIQGFGQRLGKALGEIQARLTADDAPAAIRNDLGKQLNERMPTALGFIKSSSQKMDTLINGLLRLSRAGRAQILLQSLDMTSMLKEIIGNLTIQIQGCNAAVDVENLPICYADSALVNQVFTNLLDNAIKYRDPSRPLQIRVSGQLEDGKAHYMVEDNGLGISEEHQAKVWQLFHRLDPNGTVAGEGIGLTLVRRTLDRLRGRVWLESVAGEGCRFHVELPASATRS